MSGLTNHDWSGEILQGMDLVNFVEAEIRNKILVLVGNEESLFGWGNPRGVLKFFGLTDNFRGSVEHVLSEVTSPSSHEIGKISNGSWWGVEFNS
jgi:hypothetical protein